MASNPPPAAGAGVTETAGVTRGAIGAAGVTGGIRDGPAFPSPARLAALAAVVCGATGSARTVAAATIEPASASLILVIDANPAKSATASAQPHRET